MENRFDEIFLQFFLYFLVHFSNHKGIQKDRKRIADHERIAIIFSNPLDCERILDPFFGTRILMDRDPKKRIVPNSAITLKKKEIT